MLPMYHDVLCKKQSTSYSACIISKQTRHVILMYNTYTYSQDKYKTKSNVEISHCIWNRSLLFKQRIIWHLWSVLILNLNGTDHWKTVHFCQPHLRFQTVAATVLNSHSAPCDSVHSRQTPPLPQLRCRAGREAGERPLWRRSGRIGA